VNWWEWIGLGTGVLSFVILVGQEIRTRRLRPLVRWKVAYRELDFLGNFEQHIRLSNVGDVDAREVLVIPYDCAFKNGQRMAMVVTIAAGGSEEFEVKGATEESWLGVTWRSPDHLSKTRTAWLPVLPEGEMQEEHQRQMSISWGRRLVVGIGHRNFATPGGVPETLLPASIRGLSKVKARQEKVLSRRRGSGRR
jgi:hypothetical protein